MKYTVNEFFLCKVNYEQSKILPYSLMQSFKPGLKFNFKSIKI